VNHNERGIDFDGIRASNPIAETVNRFIEIKRRGSEYVARCPFHNDSNPSFAVVPNKGKAFCNACGWHGDVIDFVAEFQFGHLPEDDRISAAAKTLGCQDFPTSRPTPHALPPDDAKAWTPILPAPAHAPDYDPALTFNPRSHDRKTNTFGRVVDWSRIMTRHDAYRDAGGRILGYVVRMEIDGKKLYSTVTWCRHIDGRESWCSVKFPTPRPLQGLDALAARPDAPVLVVEGEKKRDAAASVLGGFVAVGWSGGANNIDKTDFGPLETRTSVTLWGDADKPGRDAMQKLAARLHAAGVPVRIVDTTDLEIEFGEGADIADMVAAGWTAAQIVAWARPRAAAYSPAPIDPKPEPTNKSAAPPENDRGNRAQGSAGDTVRATPPIVSEVATRCDPIATPAPDPPAHRVSGELTETTQNPNADDVPELYSEDNVALRFSQIYADDLRYVAPWGRWMRWNSQRWIHEDTLEVADFSRKVCRSVAAYVRTDVQLTPKQQQTVANKYGAAQTVSNIERFAKADRRHAATIAQWDADIWALNTPAGVVDLRTGALTSGARAAYMTKITRAGPGGACPAWIAFLHVATAGDVDLIGFLKRMAGYCLTGSTRDHALFFVYGTGGNGKGTFLNTLQWILGDYNRTAGMDVFTEKKHDSHPTELAALMGARMVTAQETEEGKRWAEARIKALTGGDPITARFMRQDDFTYDPQFKLVIAGNHKPGLRNVDEAIKRRMHLIPFTVEIPAAKRDPRLSEKLRAEAGGILAWAIEGCLEWQQTGLRAPAAVIAATDEYLEQEDQFANWIAESCEVGNYAHASKPLYLSYKAWADRAGEFAIPQKRWSAKMIAKGFTKKETSGANMYYGIRVKYDEN
jgi:P4 family phage/plasmid primase-like protien